MSLFVFRSLGRSVFFASSERSAILKKAATADINSPHTPVQIAGFCEVNKRSQDKRSVQCSPFNVVRLLSFRQLRRDVLFSVTPFCHGVPWYIKCSGKAFEPSSD